MRADEALTVVGIAPATSAADNSALVTIAVCAEFTGGPEPLALPPAE